MDEDAALALLSLCLFTLRSRFLCCCPDCVLDILVTGSGAIASFTRDNSKKIRQKKDSLMTENYWTVLPPTGAFPRLLG